MSAALALLIQVIVKPVPGLEQALFPKDEAVAAVVKAVVTNDEASLASLTDNKFEKVVPNSVRETVSARAFLSDVSGCVYLHTVTMSDMKLSTLEFICDLPRKGATNPRHDSPFEGIAMQVWGDGSARTYRYNPIKIYPLGARPPAPTAGLSKKPATSPLGEH